jgi:5'-nucleotidase
MAANADPTPLAVDYGQHAVRVTFPGGAPAAYAPGDTVEFSLASLAMTAVDDLKDTTIEVTLDGDELGSFAVNNAASSQPNDEAGTASVSVELPADFVGSVAKLHLEGATTGTDVIVPIAVDDGLPDTTVSAADQTATRGQAKSVTVTVTPAGTDGTATIKDGSTVLGTGTVTNGAATVNIPAANLPAVGPHTLTLEYSGEPAAFSPSVGSFTLTVNKATPVITAPDVTVPVGQTGTATITVTGTGVNPTGAVTLKNGATVIGNGNLSGGSVQIALPALPNGTVVTVEYGGDANVSAGTTTFQVLKGAKANAVLTSSGASVTYGDPATVSVAVSSAPAGIIPTGTVTLLDGPNPVGVATITGGVATMTLPARSLPVGLHTLAAVYSGDDNLNATAITVPVTVTKASSSMTAKVAPKNPKAGKKVKLKITVTGDNGVVPTGKVVVKVNGKKVTVTLKNGKAKATLGTFPKGTYKAKVSYAGDASVSGSKVKVTIQVT